MRRRIAMAGGMLGAALLGAACDHTTLTGAPDNAPVAVITPSEAAVLPLDTVTFDGSASYDPNPGGTISTYTWTVVSKPAGSNASLNSTTSPSAASLFVDAAGDYTIQLTVTDNLNLSGSATYQFSAVPNDHLRIEMALSSYGTMDMDLHLVDISPGYTCANPPRVSNPAAPCLWDTTGDANHPGGRDCHYVNCDAGTGSVLDWYQQGVTADNPRLDIDGVPDNNPENINIDTPHDGTYAVYVHYYSNLPTGTDVSETVTLTIYIKGQQPWVTTFQMTTTNQLEHVANIVWANGVGTVQPVGVSGTTT